MPIGVARTPPTFGTFFPACCNGILSAEQHLVHIGDYISGGLSEVHDKKRRQHAPKKVKITINTRSAK